MKVAGYADVLGKHGSPIGEDVVEDKIAFALSRRRACERHARLSVGSQYSQDAQQEAQPYGGLCAWAITSKVDLLCHVRVSRNGPPFSYALYVVRYQLDDDMSIPITDLNSHINLIWRFTY